MIIPGNPSLARNERNDRKSEGTHFWELYKNYLVIT